MSGALARNRTAFSDLQDPTSSINVSRALFGAVTWNRTKFCDLRGRCIATYALTALCLVPITGVEPAWGFPRYVLSVVCIPFHQIGIMFGAVDEDRTRLKQIDSLLYSQNTTTALFSVNFVSLFTFSVNFATKFTIVWSPLTSVLLTSDEGGLTPDAFGR